MQSKSWNYEKISNVLLGSCLMIQEARYDFSEPKFEKIDGNR